MGILNLFGGKKDYEPAEIYLRLRSEVFSLPNRQVGSLLKDSPLLGVLMEDGDKEAVVTLVTIADGTVSLYFSNGGGILGLGQYEPVRKASFEFLAFANQFISMATATQESPLPAKGYTTFYFITDHGLFSVTAKENDLGNNRLPLSPLFLKAHEVISQARFVEEKRMHDIQELLQAVTTGDEVRTSECLDALSNPDIADPTGLTALMAAAYSGQSKIVRLLLYRKAAIDRKDSEGYTALMFACNTGSFPCAKLLVEHGAGVNETANDDSTPLMFAAQHGHNDIVRYLLSKGADPAFVGKHGLSAVGFAKQHGLVETEMILAGQK